MCEDSVMTKAVSVLWLFLIYGCIHSHGAQIGFDCAVQLLIESHGAVNGDVNKTIRCGMTHDIPEVNIVELSVLLSDSCGDHDSYTQLAHVDFWTQDPVIDFKALTTVVSGTIDPDDDVMSYLTVSQDISAVSAHDQKLYKCVIQGINSQGQPVSASDSVKDGSAQSVNYMYQNEGGAIKGFDTTAKEMNEKIADLDTSVKGLNVKMADLDITVLGMLTQIQSISGKLEAIQNIDGKLQKLSEFFFALNFANSPFNRPSKLHILNEKLYLFTKTEEKFDIDKASEVCQEYEGNLVEVDDEEEFEFIQEIVKGKNQRFYTGYSDRDTEGKFVHVNSGEELKVTKWDRDQPNNNGGKQDCVEFWPGRGLNDEVCSMASRFICEVPYTV